MSKIVKVAICGAGGTMGAGIAIVAARAGFETICHDKSAEGLARSRKAAESFFDKAVERGKMSADERSAALARMSDTTDLAALATCDLVLEAIFENLEAKRELFRELNGICRASTIFASNTSTLSITEIASGCGREDRVVGLHFCLPAQLMKLIEVSRGLNTSDATLAAAWEWAETAGQLPVQTQDKPGFILNALLVPFNNDVIRAIEAGLASAHDIDTAIKTALGYKMGPCALIDLIGLDTQIRLGEAFYPITLDKRASVPPLLRRMVAAGRLGNKSGSGFLVDGLPSTDARSSPSYSLIQPTADNVFSDFPSFMNNAVTDGEVLLQLDGVYSPDSHKTAVAVELGNNCLAFHVSVPETELTNAVGFARYKNGDQPFTNLIELVRLPNTKPEAVDAVRAVFEGAGFVVVVCADQPGRIVDRLVRPKYNDALRLVDEGLATAADLDKTCCLGLGYPQGPIARVEAGGLLYHYTVTKSIYDLTSLAGFAPATRSVTAARRALSSNQHDVS